MYFINQARDAGYVLVFVAILLFYNVPAYANNRYYVSAIGTPGGNGTNRHPWDLQTALDQPNVIQPGDMIFLLAGTYRGTFTSNLTGTADKPIILKNWGAGRAIIDGSRAGYSEKNIAAFTIRGAYTWYIGLEVTNTDTERIINISGSNPPERRGTGVDVYGPGVKVINFIIYDTGGGFGAWSTAVNSEYYGNLIYNNGWYAPDRGHGHGIYTQNNEGTKSFIDNIVFNNFGNGLQVYGTGRSRLKNFYLEGNIMFNDRWLIGGDAPLQNIELDNNFAYKVRPQFGYTSVENDGLTLRNNYFSAGISLYWWKNVTATGNTIFSGNTMNIPVTILAEGTPDLSSFHFDNNIYFGNKASPSSKELAFSWVNTLSQKDDPERSKILYLKDWREQQQDRQSKLEQAVSTDTTATLNASTIFIRKNKYDPNRTNMVVYNWGHQDKISVDVSGILKAGDKYDLHNVADYFHDIISGKYKGGKLVLAMAKHTVAKPLGYREALGPDSFPEFGTFVLVKRAK